MTDVPERTYIVWPGKGCGLAFSEPADTRTEYRRVDLCASGQVRALVWDEYAPGCFFGKSECGDYSVAPSASAFHEGEIRLSDVEGNFSYFASPEAAKAAAQADYESRILAALTPAPQPSAATPTAQEAVPVGWITQPYPGVKWSFSFHEPKALPEGWIARPLYAHPPQPSVSVAALVDGDGNELQHPYARGWNAALRALKGEK